MLREFREKQINLFNFSNYYYQDDISTFFANTYTILSLIRVQILNFTIRNTKHQN